MDAYYEYRKLDIEYRREVTGLSSFVHLHKELEIVYVISGKCVAYADKNSYLLKPGDMFISFPNQVHYYKTVENGKYALLIFSPDIIYEYASLISKSIPDRNCILSDEESELKTIFAKMSDADTDYNNLTVCGYINVLMGTVLPLLNLKIVDKNKTSAFYAIVEFCSNNFKNDITLETVSEKLHLSKYYVSHIINKRLGQNFNEYINNMRVSEALSFLRETDMKISDISEYVGFGTIRSFNRAFRTVMGVTPVEYRCGLNELSNQQ